MASLHDTRDTTFLQRSLSATTNINVHKSQLSLSESVRSLRQGASPTSNLRPSTPTSPISPLQTPTTSPRLDKYSASPIDGRASPRHAPLLRPQQSSPHFARPPLQYTSVNQDSGRSPKERLDAFLSSPQKSRLRSISTPLQAEAQYHPSPTQTPPQSPLMVDLRLGSTIGRNADPPSPSPLSKLSAAASMSVLAPSRESSDSSVSSSATTSHLSKQSHSSSQGGKAHDHDDPSSLIASAGSAEAAIQKLLQEKQALQVRNDQLWKLAENQRSMMLDLSKDLGQAIRDKERYKQRLNDHISLEAASVLQGLKDDKPGKKERRGSSSPKVNGFDRAPIDGTHPGSTADSPTSSNRSSDALSSSMKEFGFPTPPKFIPSKKGDKRVLPIKLQGEVTVVTPEKSKFRSLSLTTSVPALSATSSLYSNEKPRRAVPAPLDLVPTKLQFQRIDPDRDDDSGSEYDDFVEQDEHMREERGRRSTRDEDDVEHERRSSETYPPRGNHDRPSNHDRSTSNALNRAVSTQGCKTLPAGLTAGIGLPTSPRALLMGGLQSPLPQSLSAIASNLNPGNAVPPSSVQHLAAPHLASGLPLSPRPCDRPVNSLMPGSNRSSPETLQSQIPNLPLPRPNLHSLRVTTMSAVYADLHRPPSAQASLPSSTQVASERPDLLRKQSSQQGQIFRGFCLDGYPDLVLPPNAIPFVKVGVHTSRLIPTRQNSKRGRTSDEDATFQLAVFARSDGMQLWRVEKTLPALLLLDQSLKSKSSFNIPFPEKSLFNGHSPVKVDARRAALNAYFETLIDTPMDEKAALVLSDFFSTDVLGPEVNQVELPSATSSPSSGTTRPDFRRRKEGFLAKKGKQWGGWKARYFVLDMCELRYYDAPHGELLGIIRVSGATLARQNAEEIEEGADFRHAFMILEPKRKDPNQVVRHILCCESDEERDGWVDALLPHTESSNEDHASTSATPNGSYRPSLDLTKASTSEFRATPNGSYRPSLDLTKASSSSELRAINYNDTIAADAPKVVDLATSRTAGSSTPASLDEISRTASTRSVTSPLSQGNPAQATKTLKDSRKRSIFGFRNKVTEDSAPPSARPSLLNHPSLQSMSGRQTPTRAVFGVPLAEAARNASPKGVDVCLPAPVYRCIEYLEKSGAIDEEGIFRMSGSSRVIKDLKERFNNEGDVKLLDGEYYDVHAVASVLKLFLRELPVSVLTRELHLDFLRVIEIPDEPQKIEAINILVHKLPEANFELLASLSRFLIHVVRNAEVNKMTVRNVGIVFAPTLNIPGSLIQLFIENFETIFSRARSVDSSHVAHQLARPPNPHISSSDDIRSPRKQMFSDLSTPGPYQTTFSHSLHNHNMPPPPQRTTPFTPLQTQYEGTPTQTYVQLPLSPYPVAGQTPPTLTANGYGSLNAAIHESPTSMTGKISPDMPKKTRLEDNAAIASPILQPEVGKRKSNMQRLREFAS